MTDTVTEPELAPTRTNEWVREFLAKPFPDAVLRQLEKGGRTLTYVPGAEVIARLNYVFGTENWDTEAAESRRDPDDRDWIISKVTLVATFPDGTKARKIGYGGQKIKMLNSGDGAVDLGDEFKGAMTDALKKAATQFGIALDLSRAEEAMAEERREAEEEKRTERAYRERDLPKATDVQIAIVVAAKDRLKAQDEGGFEEFKGWWKDEIPGKKLDVGQGITEEEIERAAAWLDVSFDDVEAPFDETDADPVEAPSGVLEDDGEPELLAEAEEAPDEPS